MTITGVATFGTFGSSPTRRQNTMFQAVNNLSHRVGAHALRAGVDLLYNDDTITFLRSFRGAYTFSSLANFLTGNYAGYAQTFGNPVVSQRNPNVGIYAQDEWRAGSRLTINAGVRYDLQFLESINTDTNNVSPRLGFAWSPTDSQDTIVRGGAGVFFDRVPLRATANALFAARQHPGSFAAAPAAGCRHPAGPDRRAGLPEHPVRSAGIDYSRVDSDHGQEPAERLLDAGQCRGRACAGWQPRRSPPAISTSAARSC